MAINSHHNLVHGHIQFAGRGGNDAQVCLMRYQPVDVGFSHLIGLQGFIHNLAKGVYRNLEHLVAFHFYKRIACLNGIEVVRYAARNV